MGKTVFSQKHPIVKALSISFEEFLDLLDAVLSANIKFERYKILSQKQNDRESCNQFLGAQAVLTRSSDIGVDAEQEWIRDVFMFNMRNCDHQRSLLSKVFHARFYGINNRQETKSNSWLSIHNFARFFITRL